MDKFSLRDFQTRTRCDLSLRGVRVIVNDMDIRSQHGLQKGHPLRQYFRCNANCSGLWLSLCHAGRNGA